MYNPCVESREGRGVELQDLQTALGAAIAARASNVIIAYLELLCRIEFNRTSDYAGEHLYGQEHQPTRLPMPSNDDDLTKKFHDLLYGCTPGRGFAKWLPDAPPDGEHK